MGRLKFTGRPTFADRGKKIIADDPQPLTTIRDGRTVIALPAADVQLTKRVFDHEHSGRIVRLFPGLYKRVRTRLNLGGTNAATPADE